ncbi:Clp protease N-terminal domain-containing protein, partial [Streptococcus pluranimalium]
MVKYSQKMQDVFGLSQMIATQFSCQLLESWHLLLGLIVSDETIAGLTFREFDQEANEQDYFAATILATEKTYDDSVQRFDLYEQSAATIEVLQFAEQISQITNDEEVGTEHVLMAILLSPRLMPVRILELAGFKAKNDGEGISLFNLRQ